MTFHRVIISISYMFLFLLQSGCGGYSVVRNKNPFLDYGIKTISIPMFKNHSIIPNFEGPLTQEFYNVLSQYPGLKLISGEDLNADAILVGVIGSPPKRYDTFQKSSNLFISEGSDLNQSIGSRNRFYLPNGTSFTSSVRVLLIKNPSREDLDISKTNLAEFIVPSPKVIFNEIIALNGSFSRSIQANRDPDDGGVTNNTNTRQIFKESIRGISKGAAESFKSLVVDAF